MNIRNYQQTFRNKLLALSLAAMTLGATMATAGAIKKVVIDKMTIAEKIVIDKRRP